jgi:hypothetical protein
MTDPSPLSPSSHLAFAARRDDNVCWLLAKHPATAGILVQMRLFPSRKKACKRLARLLAENSITRVGTVCRRGKRPEYVYCGWHPSSNQLIHEVELTELCLRLHAGEILRGPSVQSSTIRPDAEVWIRGQLYYLELDRGTMSSTQIARRCRLYEGCRDFVLWVCPTVQRMAVLRRGAERLRATALFTTYGEALASPHGPIWTDYRGEKAALPREGDSGITGTHAPASDPPRPDGASSPAEAQGPIWHDCAGNTEALPRESSESTHAG